MLPTTYFISDLHLSAERPDISDCLFRFLQEQAVQAEALYVLGDLFEAWIGDDDQSAFNLSVADAFKALADTGVAVYFIHGNRDFLVRNTFAKQAGFTLLPEQVVVDLYGTPTLLMHGDELCTRDVAYQKFRRKARGWWWPRLVLALPLSTRRKIAENGRKTSKQNHAKLSMDIMDVTPQDVVKAMETHQVTRLIHGHTHRPAIHALTVNGQAAERIVLGDWYDQGSILKVDPNGVELSNQAFNFSANE
ncbi:MAG: UDP-2,3-diacylglucosamine diphosphatase [Paraglaciecola sp.]|uniref:UDP-2,3-diacylglucosamine diphosphatase n=1 Tax=Paraglaciecola sp. TaxID=1920173 RepID=UPI00273D3D35|nr:UDP-2,3-diacylglucosamine diphosphatase [Paraglaciecola sp.]MDP5029839.1 UDP-2,3-diacylglucosamine diphosphatase [Paraglaciecola sp.]MDP5133290.1 UDP-2,3-diacylglucosamine diphosphatase [Paraglaciecola sp.]